MLRVLRPFVCRGFAFSILEQQTQLKFVRDMASSNKKQKTLNFFFDASNASRSASSPLTAARPSETSSRSGSPVKKTSPSKASAAPAKKKRRVVSSSDVEDNQMETPAAVNVQDEQENSEELAKVHTVTLLKHPFKSFCQIIFIKIEKIERIPARIKSVGLRTS